MISLFKKITGHRYEIVIGQNQEATLPFALEVLAEPQEVGLLVYVHHQGNVAHFLFWSR